VIVKGTHDMKLKILFMILFTSLVLTGCSRSDAAVVEVNPLPRAAAIQTPEPTPSPAPAGALSAASNFLSWYLNFGSDENGMPLAPFENGGHHSCDCVTPAYAARIDAEVSVAPEQRGTFDPVTGGIGPIDSSRAEIFTAEGDSASVIASLEGMDWIRAVTIDLAYSGQGWLVDNVRGASIATPEGVTQLFYEWYLDYYRSNGDPLVDGAYKSSPYLSDTYINWVNGVQTSFDNDGFDPFLMSRAIPSGANVMGVKLSGNQAVVEVNRFLMTPQYNPLLVHLEKQGIFWKIVDVTMEEAPATPAEVVESFYEWYLDYTGSSGSGEFRNPLVDGAYQSSPFLTPDFIIKVDETLKSMQGGGFDPFVCAQVIPEQITTDGTYLAEMYGPDFANDASVVVRTEFTGHAFTVDLVRTNQDEDWRINNIICGSSPTGVVHAFYTWYMGCLEESPSCRTPEQDYSTSGFVSQGFVERVETLKAGFAASNAGGYNPITMSQADIPAYTLETLSETEEASEIVLTNAAWNQHTLLISLLRENGRWVIDKVGFYIANTPEAVTKAFLNQYAVLQRFPLDPGARYVFEPEKYLVSELNHAVEVYLETGVPQGRDPILLDNTIPERVEVEPALITEDRAVVVAALFAPGAAEPDSLSVDLRLIDGKWKISGVR
jgi:hypothetical protein